MIVVGVPISIKDLPAIIRGWIRQIFLEKKRHDANQKFVFVYFSYGPDFEILLASLKSLKANIPLNKIRKIYIFVDQKAPFDSEQEKTLAEVVGNIIFNKGRNFSWGPIESSSAEMKCFVKVAEKSFENDFIVKTDSDVLFINSRRMLSLLESRYHAVGDGHYTGYRYAQGGLYMIRSWVIKREFPRFTIGNIEKMGKETQLVAEDMAASGLLKTIQLPFELTRLMLFPDEYCKIKRINSLCRREFCAMHFVKDKDTMKLVAKQLGYL